MTEIEQLIDRRNSLRQKVAIYRNYLEDTKWSSCNLVKAWGFTLFARQYNEVDLLPRTMQDAFSQFLRSEIDSANVEIAEINERIKRFEDLR